MTGGTFLGDANAPLLEACEVAKGTLLTAGGGHDRPQFVDGRIERGWTIRPQNDDLLSRL